LLTDLVMPDMSGRELVEHLERLRPDLRVLYMSGQAGTEYGWMGGDVVQKPFTPEVLIRKVREALAPPGPSVPLSLET
jgi:CheY-like chemotaxis protein